MDADQAITSPGMDGSPDARVFESCFLAKSVVEALMVEAGFFP